MELNYILLDLEIVKQIKEDDKLGLIILPGKKKLFVDSSSRLSSITRWYNGHNREDTITYLEELTQKIEKFSDFVKNGNHNNLGNVLKKAINEALVGIENLKKTYSSDSITLAKLVLIVNKLLDVKIKLENMESLTNDIFARTMESDE
jgi:acyl carrier protein